MKNIGLHIRINTTPVEAIQKAIELSIPFFQCFVVSQETGKLISLSSEDQQRFLELRRAHFKDIFLHGAYWVNLCSKTINRSLAYEIQLAKQLEFSHIVLHPGSAKRLGCKQKGIKYLTKTINTILAKESDITLVLENTAHGKFTVGSDITDFVAILEKINKPERIKFCIDTAHAFSYGYPIDTKQGHDEFIQLLQQTVGLPNIALIHLNDTQQPCGSFMDHHCIVGEGKIGSGIHYFLQSPALNHIPMVMELPLISDGDEKAILEKVNTWRYKKGA